MRKRPLCFMCLIFILIRSILLIFFSGQSLVKVPASSIFLEENEVSDVLIRGQVYKKTNTSKIQILYLKNNSISVQNKSYKESQILVYDDTFTDVPIGKIITIQGKISAFEGARNPGNFDQRLYYAKQGIYGYIWSEKMIEMEGKTNTFQEELYQLRQRWKGKITEYLGEENGAVLSAILLGERSEINEETKELYQKN